MRLYYFTGTGNSLAVARALAQCLEKANTGAEDGQDGVALTPMAGLSPDEEIPNEAMGLIFPIYMYRPPHLVVNFIERIPAAPYLFVTAVNGGDPGRVFSRISSSLGKRGIALSAGFSVKMPSNYLPFGEAVDGEERENLFNEARQKISQITERVIARERHFDPQTGWFAANVHPGLMYGMGYRFIPNLDKSFLADDKCNGCAVCEKVCPVGNIRMTEGKPAWSGRCEQCYACINLCPQQAIQYGDKTAGRRRYRHPDISVADIIAQRSGA